ncbi:hypothetical protein VKT23_018881 [Stygiomarasmius scandens]|uniref:Uncharacterized protein n=1 Tax=Marasmiellus scandens TaxID=2682957 RepID=A0ABR1IPF5_9AGAR
MKRIFSFALSISLLGQCTNALTISPITFTLGVPLALTWAENDSPPPPGSSWYLKKSNSVGTSGPLTVSGFENKNGEMPITFTHSGSFAIVAFSGNGNPKDSAFATFNNIELATQISSPPTTSSDPNTIISSTSTSSSSSSSIPTPTSTTEPSTSSTSSTPNVINSTPNVSTTSGNPPPSQPQTTIDTTASTNSTMNSTASGTEESKAHLPMLLSCIFGGLLFFLITLGLSYYIWRRRTRSNRLNSDLPAYPDWYRTWMMRRRNFDSSYSNSQSFSLSLQSMSIKTSSYQTSPRSSFEEKSYDTTSRNRDEDSFSLALPDLPSSTNVSQSRSRSRTSLTTNSVYTAPEPDQSSSGAPPTSVTVRPRLGPSRTNRQMYVDEQIDKLRRKIADITSKSARRAESEISALKERITQLEACRDSDWASEMTDDLYVPKS